MLLPKSSHRIIPESSHTLILPPALRLFASPLSLIPLRFISLYVVAKHFHWLIQHPADQPDVYTQEKDEPFHASMTIHPFLCDICFADAVFIYVVSGSLSLKLAKFGLILVVLIWLSILFCIDNMCLFHTLFFVSHIFSTIPVPLHFFIIVCSSGGLQVGLLFTE
ncbi:hypothetical protein KQI72_07160 [Eubacterium sp. MSJ-21]|nr:hypothetical protein [Eubacterium sp. MSJ-21]